MTIIELGHSLFSVKTRVSLRICCAAGRRKSESGLHAVVHQVNRRSGIRARGSPGRRRGRGSSSACWHAPRRSTSSLRRRGVTSSLVCSLDPVLALSPLNLDTGYYASRLVPQRNYRRRRRRRNTVPRKRRTRPSAESRRETHGRSRVTDDAADATRDLPLYRALIQ